MKLHFLIYSADQKPHQHKHIKRAAGEPTTVTVTVQHNPSLSATASTPIVAVSSVPSAAPTLNTSTTAGISGNKSDTGFGFAYSPYKADSSCKSASEVLTDFESISQGYSLVRIYGTDCNQASTVLAAAKAHKLQLFAGVYSLSSLSSEIAALISAANGDWSTFSTISIGNELVNSGQATAPQVCAAIAQARKLLTAGGYTGHVVTVDTLVAARANPSLCDSSDYCAVNSHPFFDGNTLAAASGSFLTTQISTLRAVLANKSQNIVITETGWPWKGSTNGVAVPSVENQGKALSSIKAAFKGNPGGVILFTVFDDMWKKAEASTFFAEQFWGWAGNAPSG